MVLAAVPALAYSMAFLYETAYCQYFDIPPTFVTVSLNSFLILSLSLISSLYAVFVFGNLILGVLYPRAWQTPIGREIVAGVRTFLLVLAYVAIARPPRPLVILASFAMVVVIWFAWPLITQRRVKGYSAKVEAQAALESVPVLPVDFAVQSLSRPVRIMLFWVVLALGGAYWAGGGAARSQTKFLALEDERGLVVLRHYGDLLITAPVDRDTRTVRPMFTLIKNDAGSRVVLRQESIGPLALAKEPAAPL